MSITDAQIHNVALASVRLREASDGKGSLRFSAALEEAFDVKQFYQRYLELFNDDDS